MNVDLFLIYLCPFKFVVLVTMILIPIVFPHQSSTSRVYDAQRWCIVRLHHRLLYAVEANRHPYSFVIPLLTILFTTYTTNRTLRVSPRIFLSSPFVPTSISGNVVFPLQFCRGMETGPNVAIEASDIETFYCVVGHRVGSFRTVRNGSIKAPNGPATTTGWQVSISTYRVRLTLIHVCRQSRS